MMPSDHEPLSRWEIVGAMLVAMVGAVLAAGVAGAMLAVGHLVYRALS